VVAVVEVQTQPAPVESRFWSKVAKTPACWVWTASRDDSGYGRLKVGGKRGIAKRAHRLAWELLRGPIPDGLCVLHRCDNPPCVNPAHLFLGTKRDNTLDATAKGRHALRNLLRRRGTETSGAKLNEEQVRSIRAALEAGLSRAAVGRLYGISPAQAGRIGHRERWGWLT
jgi:hypothetical protein